MMRGQLVSVTRVPAGVEVLSAVAVGAMSIPVLSALDVDEDGGALLLLPDGSTVVVASADHEAATVTLADALAVPLAQGDWLTVPDALEVVATVSVDGEPIEGITVPHKLRALLPDRFEQLEDGVTVLFDVDSSGGLSITDVLDSQPVEQWGNEDGPGATLGPDGIRIIAGDPLGRAVEVDQDGIIIYDVGAEGERFVSSSLGGFGADALLLTDELGATLAGLSSEGLLVAQGGAFAQDISVAGEPLVGKLLGTDSDGRDGILDRLPRGILDGGIRRVVGTSGPKSGEVRAIYISVTLEPGRLYRCVALWDGYISSAGGGVRVRMRRNFTGAYPALSAPVIGTESVTLGYSPTVPVSVRAEGVLSVDTATNFALLLTYQGLSGSTADRRDMTLYVEDVGPGTLAVESNSSGTEDSGATRKTYTSIWRASDSATFDGDGNRRSASGDIVSGYYSGYGSQRGAAVFTATATYGETSKTISQALSGASLVKAEIRLYANHTWNSAGGTVLLGELGNASLPSSLTSGQAGSTSQGGHITSGQSKWFRIPVSWFDDHNRGVVVGSGVTSDMEYYVRLNGHTDSPSSTRPHLRLTYVR